VGSQPQVAATGPQTSRASRCADRARTCGPTFSHGCADLSANATVAVKPTATAIAAIVVRKARCKAPSLPGVIALLSPDAGELRVLLGHRPDIGGACRNIAANIGVADAPLLYRISAGVREDRCHRQADLVKLSPASPRRWWRTAASGNLPAYQSFAMKPSRSGMAARPHRRTMLAPLLRFGPPIVGC